ncbi:hypothetical protein JOC37_002469 [Desulfohalotomaculum tongense]|uniref:helix-turn-helix domain-containing protein n=1 Tax=Desulforadius tongensis TaxID=1216062 RepID=UPI0019599E11|nr:helix-turn-helix transcriptional regulator [Desulforadius tongensis]MBM7856044.1 hypothetical protein [Desulforadius tongensis]
MSLIRIGNKIISKQKINQTINRLLHLRECGLSQTEAASRLGIDRTFVSRLENLGEIRKGKSIAVIGFPISNKEELESILLKEGVDLVYLFTEQERWDFVKNSTGLDLFNTVMDIIAKVQSCEQVVVIGSNKRIKLVEAVLDKEVIPLVLGKSPIKENRYIEPNSVLEIVRAVKRG